MINTKNHSFSQTCKATRLIFLAFGIGISSWAPMVPFVKTKLNVDDAELGLILFVFGIGAMLAMPITGYLIHKVGTRLISLIAALCVVVIMPFLAIANTIITVCLVLFFLAPEQALGTLPSMPKQFP